MLTSRLGLAFLLTGQLAFTACTEAELRDTAVRLAVAAVGAEDAIALSPDAIASDSSSEFVPGSHQYGAHGTISQQQLQQLQTLAWPQTYEDVIGAYGYPSHRTESADYYAIENLTSRWAVIAYDGTTAINYRLEERHQ
ncbi:MAG TPA: hypothetical protein V6D07_09765 [Trichocoleus sp.]